MAKKAYTMLEATFQALTQARAHGFVSTAEALEEILADIDPPTVQQFSKAPQIIDNLETIKPNMVKKMANVT